MERGVHSTSTGVQNRAEGSQVQWYSPVPCNPTGTDLTFLKAWTLKQQLKSFNEGTPRGGKLVPPEAVRLLSNDPSTSL